MREKRPAGDAVKVYYNENDPQAHGVPARVGRLRGYGNAIVPHVAAAFLEAAL